jgi:hypothetical protein
MAMKFHQGYYEVKNKEKYAGSHLPYYRSGWELQVMIFFDNHPNILQWSSESIAIPYFDPLTNKERKYIPDFFIVYLDVEEKKHSMLIEVKPSTQTGQKKTRSAVNKAHIARNHAKWTEAVAFCKHNEIEFKILTENEIFGKK